MSTRISPIASARMQHVGVLDWIRRIDVPMPWGTEGPVTRLDHFRVNSAAAGPRLESGVCALTYVPGDSEANLRIRDSLGHDVRVRRGGLVWSRAGSGVMHEHLPDEHGRELHCLHVCVKHELLDVPSETSVSCVEPEQVPVWKNGSGDCVRVVAGSYAGLVSPLIHMRSFSLLDVRLRSTICCDVRESHAALVYVLSGCALAITDAEVLRLESAQAFVLHNPRAIGRLQLVGSAQLLIVAGPAPREAAFHGRPTPEPASRDAAFSRRWVLSA